MASSPKLNRLSPHSFVSRGKQWILRHLAEFNPFKDSPLFDMKNGQRVGELAILLRAYACITGQYHSAFTQPIVELLRQVQHTPAFSDRLMRSSQEFILFAEVYSSLRAVGYEDIPQRQLIQRAIDAGYLNFTERLPHRVMDVAACLERGGFRHPLPSLQQLFRRSLLTPVPCPMLLDEDALYFLTHIIMFVFDFGTREDFTVSDAYRAELEPLLSALIVAMCQEHHWDLLAELLLCWDCVALPHQPIYVRGWQSLISVQTKEGAVPGPEWAHTLYGELAKTKGPSQPGRFEFDHHYHTTLVSIIAGALRLKRQAQQRDKDSQPGHGQIVLDRVQVTRASLLGASAKPGAIVKALTLHHKWLEQLMGARNAEYMRRPEALAMLLMDEWICHALMPAASGHSHAQFVAQVGESLLAQGLTMQTDWARTPPLLKFVAAALLRRQGVGLAVLDDYVQAAAQVLAQQARKNPAPDAALIEKQLALHQMRLHPHPTALKDSALLQFHRSWLLTDSAEKVNDLMLQVNAHTLYGLRPPSQDVWDSQLLHLLPLLASSFLRRYNLSTGCKLLRSALYLGADDLITHTCIDFLLLHQRAEGAFGFAGVALQSDADVEGQSPEPVSALYLPLALECVWTLAESTGRWSLMKAFSTLA
jgi:hypothetical protein